MFSTPPFPLASKRSNHSHLIKSTARIAAPLVAVIGILMALIAYGFAAQKTWSRHLVITMFTLIIVYALILGALNLIHQAIMWRAIINGTLFGGASVWYFYLKPNVAAYFCEHKKKSVGEAVCFPKNSGR